MRLSEKTLTDDRSIFDSIWHQLAAKKPPTLAGQIWQKWKPNSCLPRLLFPPANWSLRQTQGLAPGPLHTDACLNPLLNNMLNKTPIKSLRIACKALSLDTPPTIPLMGLIGVFRWVHLATTDLCHSRLCSSYPLQPSVMFWRCFISTCVYLSCWHLKTPLRASQGVFLIYGNCLTHDITLGLLTSNDYSFSFSACYISSSRRNPWSDT